MDLHNTQFLNKKEISTLANQASMKIKINQYLSNKIAEIADEICHFKKLLKKYSTNLIINEEYTTIKDDLIKYNQIMLEKIEKRKAEMNNLHLKKSQLREQIEEITQEQSLEQAKQKYFMLTQMESFYDSEIIQLKNNIKAFNSNHVYQENSRDFFIQNNETENHLYDELNWYQDCLLLQSKYHNKLLNKHKALKRNIEIIKEMNADEYNRERRRRAYSHYNKPLNTSNINDKIEFDNHSMITMRDTYNKQTLINHCIDLLEDHVSDDDTNTIFEDKVIEINRLSEDCSVKMIVPSLNLKQISFNKIKVRQNENDWSSEQREKNESLTDRIWKIKNKIKYQTYKNKHLKSKVKKWKEKFEALQNLYVNHINVIKELVQTLVYPSGEDDNHL